MKQCLCLFFPTAEGDRCQEDHPGNAVLRVAQRQARPAGQGRHLPGLSGKCQGKNRHLIVLSQLLFIGTRNNFLF